MGWVFAVVAAVSLLGSGMAATDSSVPAASSTVLASSVSSAAAATSSGFDPGYIIDDSKFFNPNAMSASDIQAFLNSRVPSCAGGYTCLKSYTETTRTIAADPMCSSYGGAPNESAATIIWKVAQACGISPQVLLVTLQKEQGLVMKSAPSQSDYLHAMGAGCPDSGTCDVNYYGFFNQVHYGAYLMKRYTEPPGTGPGTSYTTRFDQYYSVGQTTAILYSPNSCGSAPVYVANQATHALYLYTPYQPNAAALANPYGTGDVCSSYGNRNFWVYYRDWFGASTGADQPVGSIDYITTDATGTTVAGWSLDPNTPDPISVQVGVDGATPTTVLANVPRSDVQAAYPGTGLLHGFSTTLTIADGDHSVCVYGVNVGVGANSLIGCRLVSVHRNLPFGSIDVAYSDEGGAHLIGWAADPNTTAPIFLHVYVDGTFFSGYSTGISRTDILSVYPQLGTQSGFNITLNLPAGQHSICVFGLNVGDGQNNQIACTTQTVPTRTPLGYVDSLAASPGGGAFDISGWTFDPSSTASTVVHVYVDGSFVGGYGAGSPRADIAAAFPGEGANHGINAHVVVPPGQHSVCVYGLNIQADKHLQLACQTVSVAPVIAIGHLDALTGGVGQITADGWTLSPDSSSSTWTHVYVDGVYATGAGADIPRSDVAAAYPANGLNHGFHIVITLPGGPHTVCVYGFTASYDRASLLGCQAAVAG